MVVNPSVRHVASKNVPELILVGTVDVRGRRLVLEFDAVELGATHDTLLLIDRQDFPLSHLVLPFLKQQHGTASAGDSFGQERDDRSVEQRWILRAVDEAGKITIMPIRPTRILLSSPLASRASLGCRVMTWSRKTRRLLSR